MRIFNPQNHLGHKLLSEREVTASQVVLTKTRSGNTVEVVASDIGSDVTLNDWEIAQVLIVLGGGTEVFEPEIVYTSSKITLTVCDADDANDLGWQTLQIKLVRKNAQVMVA